MTAEHAGIICRQLGFDDGKLATVSSGTGNVWLRLRDSCSLAHIQACPRYGFGMTHCGHGHDIGIYCYDITNASCEAPAALTGHFGHLRSFGHPTTQYGPNLNCTWWITVPEGFAVRLTFTDFSLEDSVDCENDYVEVRDIGMGSFENWTSAAVIGRYCGATNPGTLTSTTNRLVVHFRSNEATSSGGMAAYFSSDCSGATVWNKVNNTSDLSGTDFMIRSINNASNCLLECDHHQFCFKVYYDATNETCYMKMATFYGRNISLSGLELETYEKKCINGHQWTTQDNRAIRSEELAVEYTSNVDNCLASCRMRPTCLAIDYSASSKKCTLHSVNSADTSLTLESSTVYHETTVPKTCAEVLANNGTSGWYGLKVATGQLVFTYCDALRFGGGWTLLMAKRARSCTSPVSELPVSQYSLLESEFSILQELLRFKDRTLVDYYELLLEDSGRQWNSTWMVPNTMSDYNDVTVTSFEGVTSMLGMARGHIQSLAHISAISNISGLPYIGENCSSPVTDASNTIFLWMRTPTTANKDKKCMINVCANGGHCRYENGNTTCTCAKGFYGEKCEHSLPSVTAQFKKLPDTAVRFADITKTKVSTRVLDCMSFCVLHGCSGFYWQPKTEVKPMNCELLSEQLFGSLLYSEVHRDVYVRLQEGDIDWEQ
ncbi:uncharacterized protein LOC106171828 [Lingula anatina]|uniref:Uncharacterized protein LOC106171828 n=1 Tax=Lingula anatina TaxID=7574 RepID=A0A1S3JBH9_LINAN|nr:uncharacterized protein LOC106171828 [Lingula anatina]|eukprot:XP_013407757.1 uncharacterized protein LOC106171828 [Lingula anatina]